MVSLNISIDTAVMPPRTEIIPHGDIPDKMESYSLSGGKYAVFIHNGPVNTFPETMRYIFESWLPISEYEIDNREHFEILPENYNPMDPEAREEVWIPIKNK